jgi:signal transduction histidine kinase
VRGASRDCTARKLAEEAAHNLSGRLIHAQEETQRQLAGELHDDLSQSLALLSVELEMFGQNPQTEPQRIAARMDEFSTQVKGLSSEVHRLSHDLHPAKLDQLGLVAAVRGFCKEFAVAHEVAIEFTEHDVPRTVAADAALCLYRIAQEALQNVVKHSGGTMAKVELTHADGHLRLVVSDDGAGFDPQATRTKGSLGLVSMNERARFAGGRLIIDSHPGAGTRVEVCVPVGERVIGNQ